jgi:glycosyltransferase involved in cell wall biosynthesis
VKLITRKKNKVLGGASALLFPIDWPEPFGSVMIEASACGTPVIGFPRGSVPEIIVEGETGFIVEDIDPAVEAVGKIDQISRANCRREFEQRFTDRHMVQDYIRICQQLLSRSSTKAAV